MAVTKKQRELPYRPCLTMASLVCDGRPRLSTTINGALHRIGASSAKPPVMAGSGGFADGRPGVGDLAHVTISGQTA